MGRPAGAANKNKQALIALLEAKCPGYHPVIEMAIMATERGDDGTFVNDLSARFNAHKEVAKYVTPQLKAMEIEAVNHEPVRVEIVRYSDIKDTEQPS